MLYRKTSDREGDGDYFCIEVKKEEIRASWKGSRKTFYFSGRQVSSLRKMRREALGLQAKW